MGGAGGNKTRWHRGGRGFLVTGQRDGSRPTTAHTRGGVYVMSLTIFFLQKGVAFVTRFVSFSCGFWGRKRRGKWGGNAPYK